MFWISSVASGQETATPALPPNFVHINPRPGLTAANSAERESAIRRCRAERPTEARAAARQRLDFRFRSQWESRLNWFSTVPPGRFFNYPESVTASGRKTAIILA